MFDSLNRLPMDPILGLMAAYREDPTPDKIDLGVGVYRDETGNTPILAAVKAAERLDFEAELTKAYVGPAGNPGFNASMQELMFGADHPAVIAGRVRTVQTPGGCGALRVGAELVRRVNAKATVWVSDPTWANHQPLLGNAGLALSQYPYYDYQTHDLRFDAMLEALERASAGDLVLLHACCHNPCGADLAPAQWLQLADLMARRELVPFIDSAYQGFGEGLEEDAYGIRVLAERLPELIVASSCSKNFGLYRDRVGALALVSANEQSAAVVASHTLSTVRGMYSMPPDHGGAIVGRILTTPELGAQWVEELTTMRNRLNGVRAALAKRLADLGASQDFAFITRQKGMFSFLGLSPEQVHILREEYHVYMVESSRINVAGVNESNLDPLANAIVSVL